MILRPLLLGAVVVVTLGGLQAASAAPPSTPGDVTEASDGDDGGDVAPEPPPEPEPCVFDHDSASRAVTDAYADLARVYRTRVPGPTGEVLLRRRLDALLARLVDVEAFCEQVLREMWVAASPEQRARWREAMDHMLRNRYLRGFEGPNQHLIRVLRSTVSCHTAAVRVALSRDGSRDKRVVDVELGHQSGDWRVFDVTLDGVSLVRTWRSRFLRIFRDGGLDAVDAQMRLLGERYRERPDDDF